VSPFSAWDALCAAQELWPSAAEGVHVGKTTEGRFSIGWVRKDKRVVKFSAATFEEALDAARCWARNNPARSGL
jgi:hypothetical protein